MTWDMETQGEPQTWNAQGTHNILVLLLLLSLTGFPKTRQVLTMPEQEAASCLISAAEVAAASAQRPPRNLGCSRHSHFYHVFEMGLVERSCSVPKGG